MLLSLRVDNLVLVLNFHLGVFLNWPKEKKSPSPNRMKYIMTIDTVKCVKNERIEEIFYSLWIGRETFGEL